MMNIRKQDIIIGLEETKEVMTSDSSSKMVLDMSSSSSTSSFGLDIWLDFSSYMRSGSGKKH